MINVLQHDKCNETPKIRVTGQIG